LEYFFLEKRSMEVDMRRKRFLSLITGLVLLSCQEIGRAQETPPTLPVGCAPQFLCFDFANLNVPIAGVAGGDAVVFVGEPLNGSVAVLSRFTGQRIAQLPPPPNGFILPFIMHSLGEGHLAVLDAGGLPQPQPFVPANPVIYEYTYSFDALQGFTASLVRTISFATVLVGFPEDFAHLDDGRYLLSDAVLGSIWIAKPDGTIVPGIVPKSFTPQDFIPTLAFCPISEPPTFTWVQPLRPTRKSRSFSTSPSIHLTRLTPIFMQPTRCN